MTQRTPTSRQRTRSGNDDDLLADAARKPLGGPDGNARLTGATAAVLLVLLAAEGLTTVALADDATLVECHPDGSRTVIAARP